MNVQLEATLSSATTAFMVSVASSWCKYVTSSGTASAVTMRTLLCATWVRCAPTEERTIAGEIAERGNDSGTERVVLCALQELEQARDSARLGHVL